jgi:hypothetical protein
VRIGHADDGSLADAWAEQQNTLDLGRIDVLATGDD